MFRILFAVGVLFFPTAASADSILDGLWISRDGETVLKFDPQPENYPQLEGGKFDMLILVSESDQIADVCLAVGAKTSRIALYKCEETGLRQVTFPDGAVAIDGTPLAHWNPK